MMLYKILNDLKKDNSRNYKLEVLENSKCQNFKTFLELVFDKIQYKYYIRSKQLNFSQSAQAGGKILSAQEFKTALEPLYTRSITGHKALNYLQDLVDSLIPEYKEVLKCILDRDLHCGVNLKTAEKVYGSLKFKMPYMRCSLMDKVQNVKFPAILQLKADGTYRTFVKSGDEIQAYSRSGEEYEHPKIFEVLKNCPDGAYIGELIANGYEGTSAEVRYASNGALNSLNAPEDVTFFVWDYLTHEELIAKKSSKAYWDRFEVVKEIFTPGNYYTGEMPIRPIESVIVDTLETAQAITKKWISQGREGAVLKDFRTPFEDKTSKYQIKFKLEMEIDVRCIGFTKGKGKFSSTFGAIEFKTDDGLLEGQCSGISDSMRQEINANRDAYIGQVFTIKGNDITQAKKSNIYGVMHPQFLGFRNDKQETDTIERIRNMCEGF